MKPWCASSRCPTRSTGKVYKSLRENLTTIKRELGAVPSWEESVERLVANFQSVLGPLTRAELSAAVHDKAAELARTLTTDEWLSQKGPPRRERRVKIATDVHVVQRMYKAPGGLIRAISEVKEGRLVSVSLSGDFFFYPAEKLVEMEKALEGTPLAEVEEAIARFYQAQAVESPGVQPADFARVLVA